MVGAAAGGLVGALVFAVFAALGVVLTNRVANPIPLFVLIIAGAYAGWLLGVVVFGAVRSAGETDNKT
ncbi:MAG TPA: hypothetical protein VNA65_05840 [Candidatus Dormibacteraeota bacterium]|nr:hypothetical protein [Candidatus Dormibacteraeota bacterium]